MFKRKGGGAQRPFEQCSKKLHFSYTMASLIVLLNCTNPFVFLCFFEGTLRDIARRACGRQEAFSNSCFV